MFVFSDDVARRPTGVFGDAGNIPRCLRPCHTSGCQYWHPVEVADPTCNFIQSVPGQQTVPLTLQSQVFGVVASRISVFLSLRYEPVGRRSSDLPHSRRSSQYESNKVAISVTPGLQWGKTQSTRFLVVAVVVVSAVGDAGNVPRCHVVSLCRYCRV